MEKYTGDKTGSSPAAAASCPSCRNLVVLQGAQQRFFDFLIACAYGPYPCDQHKVDAVGKFALVETVRLTKQTLDAVSSCGSRSQRVFLPWTHHDDTIGGIRGFPLRILFFSSSDAPVFS